MFRLWLVALLLILVAFGLVVGTYAQLSDTRTASGMINAASGEAATPDFHVYLPVVIRGLP